MAEPYLEFDGIGKRFPGVTALDGVSFSVPEGHVRGLIGENDFSLFKITDDLDEAVREILDFYSNYHSSRYVDDRLVIRVRRAPDPAQLEWAEVPAGSFVMGSAPGSGFDDERPRHEVALPRVDLDSWGLRVFAR